MKKLLAIAALAALSATLSGCWWGPPPVGAAAVRVTVAPAAARVAAVPMEAMGRMARSSFPATRPKPDRCTPRVSSRAATVRATILATAWAKTRASTPETSATP